MKNEKKEKKCMCVCVSVLLHVHTQRWHFDSAAAAICVGIAARTTESGAKCRWWLSLSAAVRRGCLKKRGKNKNRKITHTHTHAAAIKNSQVVQMAAVRNIFGAAGLQEERKRLQSLYYRRFDTEEKKWENVYLFSVFTSLRLNDAKWKGIKKKKSLFGESPGFSASLKFFFFPFF